MKAEIPTAGVWRVLPAAVVMALSSSGCNASGLTCLAAFGKGRLEITPESPLEFGSSSPSGTPVIEEIRLSSTGPEPITVEGIEFEKDGKGSFYLANDPSPVNLDPGEGRVALLGFLPVDVGQYEGILVVYTDGNGGEPLGISMLGYGCEDSDRDGTCNNVDVDGRDTGTAAP